jgi:hypothetical protein
MNESTSHIDGVMGALDDLIRCGKTQSKVLYENSERARIYFEKKRSWMTKQLIHYLRNI